MAYLFRSGMRLAISPRPSVRRGQISRKATVCIRHKISSIVIYVLDPKRYCVDSTAVHRHGPLLEPSSEDIRNQPTVQPVFLDHMLENHGSSGMLRDSFALLRVSFTKLRLIIYLIT